MSVRQKEVYDFISQYHNSEGICPSLTDIAKGLGLASTTVDAHVRALRVKGYVTNTYRVPRSLKIVPVTET